MEIIRDLRFAICDLRLDVSNDSRECVDDPVLILFGQLVEQRQDDGCILRILALRETADGAPRSCRIRALTVRVHHTASGGDPCVEHPLHEGALIDPGAETDRVALPVASPPPRLARYDKPVNGPQTRVITRGKLAPASDDRRQALQLLAS